MTPTEVAATYDRDGFFSPCDVLSSGEAQALRSALESGEAELADQPAALGALRSFPDRLLPGFDALIHHPALLAPVQAILGEDLLVWNAGLFIKEANTGSYVSWHQDLTYWALDEADEVTAWVALSPATVASGCMRFLPGSHRQAIVDHRDTFDANNLLTRGQEIAVAIDESQAVDIELQPGQASLHHGHLFHASSPNRTSDRRIGVAIRYIKPSMKQVGGQKTAVRLVSGEDRFGHFRWVGAPRGRLHPQDIQDCLADSAMRREMLYAGARKTSGQRY